MNDGNNTTFDWKNAGDICVLPVGSFEQHSRHLPLATDNILAEYFSRMVAEEFDAALLAALPFGTCLEHKGFRGSFTLRPETLMQVVRDLTDEMEAQGFKILIIVNGHGGNFSLHPVVRDINRADRPLKILIVQPFEFFSPEIPMKSAGWGFDLHAGEAETSMMMAVRPDLVRQVFVDKPDDKSPVPLRQSDLNTFGTGHFAPEGAIGFPSCATKELGEKLIASIRERLLPFLKERIERLRKGEGYGGKSGGQG